MSSIPTPVRPRRRLRVPLFVVPVRAGFPSPADDFVDRGLDFNEYLIKDASTTFTVRAEGESMVGAGIFPGDLLLVDRGMVARPGDVIIAALDGEFTVKRLIRREGRYVLAAENPAYPAIALDDASEMSVWGVVTYVVHGLRSADRRR